MTKIFVVLFILLVFKYINVVKTQESVVKTNITENTTNYEDEDESASIQVVHRNILYADKEEESTVKYDNQYEEETVGNKKEDNYTEVLKETNLNTSTAKAEEKYDSFFEDIINDSGDLPLKNQDNIKVTAREKNEYGIDQGKIDLDSEYKAKANNDEEKSEEDSIIIDEDENNWRSAEHSNSKEKKHKYEASSEASIEDDKDFSVEDYMDKKIDLQVKGRMEERLSERRQHFNTKPMNARHYAPPEDHDSGPTRGFGEMMVPHYRPVLTRNGIVYAPNLFPIQTRPSLLERLSGRNWLPNRVHNMNPEAEALKAHHHRTISSHQYEDSKIIDDYNDYGSNTNTYSYTPVRKVTTQTPPQQIVAPNKFDVFQKLVEASNHPKSQKRTFNEFPVNYYPQRQYPESYGPYNIRRVRRNASWDEPFQDM